MHEVSKWTPLWHRLTTFTVGLEFKMVPVDLAALMLSSKIIDLSPFTYVIVI